MLFLSSKKIWLKDQQWMLQNPGLSVLLVIEDVLWETFLGTWNVCWYIDLFKFLDKLLLVILNICVNGQS